MTLQITPQQDEKRVVISTDCWHIKLIDCFVQLKTMSAVSEHLASLKETFYKYAVFGSDSHNVSVSSIGLDNRNFVKMMKDGNIYPMVRLVF